MEKIEAIKRGSIFYFDLETGVGSEQNGLRPVMIVQNDKGNTYSPTVIVVPITSKPKKFYLPTHVYIGKQFGLPEDSMLLAEHIRTVDKKRLLGFIGIANTEFMSKVDNCTDKRRTKAVCGISGKLQSPERQKRVYTSTAYIFI